MSKKKRRATRSNPVSPRSTERDAKRESEYDSPRAVGVRAFAVKDYDGAILAWAAILRSDPSMAVSQALAEAYFRRACTQRLSARVVEDLTNAVDLMPDDPIYRYHLGLAQHRAENLPAAIEAYRESLKHDPINFAGTAYVLCLALAQSGGDPRSDAAWELLTPAQQERIAPQNAALSKAIAALKNGKFQTAEPLLQRIVNQYPGVVRYYLGVTAWQRGSPVEAITHWIRARTAGFDTPTLRHNLMAAYVIRITEQADSPSLLDTIKAALKISPDAPALTALKLRAEFLAGNRAAEEGDWKRALAHWRTVQIANAKQSNRIPRELIANIALAYEHMGHWIEAADTWREVIRRRPRRGENVWSAQHIVQLWRHIDTLYAQAGHLAKSAETLRYAIKAQPDDLTLRLALVRRHMENENWDSAETAVLRVLEIAPKHPEALALYAEILDTSGDLDMMIEAWKQVADAGDAKQSHLARMRLIKLYDERGQFYLTVDDAEAAAEDILKALQLDPDNALLRARYGAVLVSQAPDRARAEFEQLDQEALANDSVALTVIQAWHRAGEQHEADQWLSRAIADGNPRASLLTELGASIFEADEKAAAAYFAQAAGQADKTEKPGLLTTIGVVYAEHDQSATAYDFARQALRIDVNYGPAHFNIGLWDAARGRRRAALEHFNTASRWAQRIQRDDIADGIEEAIELFEDGYVPTMSDILDTIDPDGFDEETRRLLGEIIPNGGS